MPLDELISKKEDDKNLIHVHLLHRHVPIWLVIFLLITIATSVGLIASLYTRVIKETKLLIPNGENEKVAFIYGSWPALQNVQFFEKVKQSFISQNATFIEANLSSMILRVYKDGKSVKEIKILSKGKEGSWWETPAGLYKIETKEKDHFSSFGKVYQPWSMAFQGNFFIHGWPYYPNGDPVSKSYSGGCIRLSTDDAKEVFELINIGTPVLIFKNSFNGDSNTLNYEQKGALVSAESYIVADLNNNFIFAENKPNEIHSIASITKLMTALVAVEYINVDREVTINSSMITKTSIPRLKEGEKISVLNLLSLLLMESSNEAALAIASPIGKTQFINLMNNKSKAIGMENTYFADTSGALGDNSSTAEDLFMLAKYLYYNRSFIVHMSMGKENRAAYEPSPYINISNFNLMHTEEKMIGGKIGLSTSAKNSILAIFELEIENKKGPVAIILLRSDNIETDIKSILQYIKTNFKIQTPAN